MGTDAAEEHLRKSDGSILVRETNDNFILAGTACAAPLLPVSMTPTSELLKSLQEEIAGVIRRHFAASAVSISSLDRKETGNAYQTVRLGDEILPGFRSEQRQVFAGLDLARRTVVDLGANLGEVCRDAVRRGAASVLGIEYDPFFVQMARYVSAFCGLANVAFRQGDLREVATYEGQYDVVSALSVFTYIADHLDLVAAMTREIAVIETHSVRADWTAIYLAPLRRHFRHVALIDVTDHRAADLTEFRYLLLASQQSLESVLGQRARDLASLPTPFRVSLATSAVDHYDDFLRTAQLEKGAPLAALRDAVDRRWPELSAATVCDEVARRGLVQAPSYWAAFVKGGASYELGAGGLTGNIYLEVLKALSARGLYDPGMAGEVLNDAADWRLARRLETVTMRHEAQPTEPIILYNPFEVVPGLGEVYSFDAQPSGVRIGAIAIDGHHRMFSAYVRGAEIPVLPIWYAELRTVAEGLAMRPHLKGDVWGGVFDLITRLWGAGSGHTTREAATASRPATSP